MEEVRYQDVIHDYGFGGAPKDGGATVVANEARAVTLAMTTVPGVMRGLKTGHGRQHAGHSTHHGSDTVHGGRRACLTQSPCTPWRLGRVGVGARNRITM
jgi:hypothetical protein